MLRKVITAVLATMCLLPPLFAAGAPAEKEWTVMMFNNAKNNLEKLQVGAINALEKAGSDDKVNIVVQLGRSGAVSADGGWKGARRYLLVRDSDGKRISSPILWEQAADMGDYRSVVDFVQWAARNYPARHYMLILADHGSGWLDELKPSSRGISSDNETGNFIRTAQLAPMMAGVTAATGKKIDIFYSAACLMQGIEVAYEIKDYADIIVGSEDVGYTSTVAGHMWAKFFKQLKGHPEYSAEEYAKVLVDSYIYGLKREFYMFGEGTQSAIRGSALAQLANDLSQWSDRAIKIGDADAVRYAKRKVHRYKLENYADLKHFMRLYADKVDVTPTATAEQISAFRAFTETVLARFDEAVLVHNAVDGSKNRHSNGLSIEIPILDDYGVNSWFSLPYGYEPYDKLAFAKDSGWKNFCDYLYSVK